MLLLASVSILPTHYLSTVAGLPLHFDLELETGDCRGVAPLPPVLQTSALLRELCSLELWSSRSVTLRRLPVIGRTLCY